MPFLDTTAPKQFLVNINFGSSIQPLLQEFHAAIVPGTSWLPLPKAIPCHHFLRQFLVTIALDDSMQPSIMVSLCHHCPKQFLAPTAPGCTLSPLPSALLCVHCSSQLLVTSTGSSMNILSQTFPCQHHLRQFLIPVVPCNLLFSLPVQQFPRLFLLSSFNSWTIIVPDNSLPPSPLTFPCDN